MKNIIEYPQYCPNCRLRYDEWEFEGPFAAHAVVTIEDILNSNLTIIPLLSWTCIHPAGCGLNYFGRFVLYYDGPVLQSWEIIQPELSPEKINAATQTAMNFQSRD